MLPAFKKYLSTLKLSPTSRKLYLGDIRRFLSWLADRTQVQLESVTLSQLTSSQVYLDYLDSLRSLSLAPSMLKRTTASLRQLGNFLHTIYSVPNPLANFALSPHSPHSSPLDNYIKHFSKYLNESHLSPLTIKSYKSDLTRYFSWAEDNLASNKIADLLKEKNLKKYLNHLSNAEITLPSTIERKNKSLTRFQAWYTTVYSPNHVSDNTNDRFLTEPRHSLSEGLPHSESVVSTFPDQSWFSVKNFNYRRLAFFATLLLFIATLSVFGYRQFNQDVRLTAAFPSTPVTPNRQLSFQGRLEDAGGTPITTATNFIFKLFTASSGGTELYSTGTCSIDPDSDGVFSTQIGDTCGAGITSSVFTENADVWLEVTVGAETLDPRQQIATVAYALNSETIQGFPLSSTVSAIRNTVVPMNQWGEIIVGEQSPRLTGVSGTFAISAPALTLTTTTGSNGNITLAPDGNGVLNVQGSTVSTTSFFNVSANQLTTGGTLIKGNANNNNTGYNLLDLLSGSSPTSKFSVDYAGNTTLAGDLTITGDDLFMTTNTAGYLLVADGTNYNPTAITGDISLTSGGVTAIGADKITESMLKAVNSPTDELCLGYESTVGDFEWQTCGTGGGGGSNWRLNAGTISPNNDTLDLLIGANATTSAKAGFININSGTPTATVSAGTAGGTFLTADGALSTTARQSLTLGNSSSYNTTGNILLNPNGTGNVGIGTTTPISTAHINGTTSITGGATLPSSGEGMFLRYNSSTAYLTSQLIGSGMRNFEFGGADIIFKAGSGASPTERLRITSGGNLGVGTTGPDAKIDSLATSGEQLRLTYTDGSVYAGFTLNSSGQLTITPTGNITTLTGDTYITSGLSTYSTAVSDGTIEATRFCTGDGETNCVTDFSSIVSPWTDAGTYLYPTSAEVLGNSTSGGANKLAGIYLGDSSPLVFGTDNDISFSFTGSTLGSTLTSGSMIGINTTTALATFDIRSSLGTIPVASISGSSSKATLVVDQSGIGDLFTASKSGDTKFVITNAGNVGIGISSPTAKLEIGGATSTISNNSGDITIDAASDFISFASDSIGNILNGYFAGEIGIGLADATGLLHVQGATTGKALAIFDELGDQDLLTASGSGVTRFRLTHNGSLSLDGDYLNFGLTDGTSGYGFRDNGGTLQFKHNSGSWADVGSGGASWWDQTSGTLQPYNKTVDLLLGGTATSSAKFAVLNMNSGTPTASISGNIIIGQGGYLGSQYGPLNLAYKSAPNTWATGLSIQDTTGYILGLRYASSTSSSYYLDPASTGTSLSIEGNIVGNGAFYLSTGSDATAVSIGTTGAGKLDAGTIDPPYTINGEKFATYMSSMTGVKEETTGTVSTQEFVPGKGYRAILDFANSLTGSDLWLFAQTSNLKTQLDKLVVLTTAAGAARTWYEVDALNGQLHLYSQTPTLISYRLTAPRFDAANWSNTRDSESSGFVINTDTSWSVSSQIANFYNQLINTAESTLTQRLDTNLISPLDSGSAIIITQDPSSPPMSPPSGQSYTNREDPLLIVDGTLDAATLSARTAHLNNVAADTITARSIVADTITANTIVGLDAKIASLSAGVSDEEFETITDRIKARLQTLSGVEGLSINESTAEDIPIPDPESAVDPSIYLSESNISTHSATIASADIDFATINNYLAVIGQATITTLDITDTLYASSINTKSGLIALADNTLVVDATGHVTINGDLTVSGKILADSASLNSLEIGSPATPSALGKLLAIYNESGEAVATIDASGSANLDRLTTNMITIASPAVASATAGLSELIGRSGSNATAGVSTLVSPNTEIAITSPYVTPNSLVYLTPTGNTDNKVLFVKSKTSCPSLESTSSLLASCTPSFTVGVDSPASSDISFNWWIIELGPATEEQI